MFRNAVFFFLFSAQQLLPQSEVRCAVWEKW